MTLLIALFAASACAPAQLDRPVKPAEIVKPTLPPPCDLAERANRKRYERCQEQTLTHHTSTKGAQMFTPGERSFEMNGGKK